MARDVVANNERMNTMHMCKKIRLFCPALALFIALALALPAAAVEAKIIELPNGLCFLDGASMPEKTSYHEGLAAVYSATNNDYKFGYVDLTGELVIPLQYGICYSFSEGLAAVGNDIDGDGQLEYGYINKAGQVVVPFQYDLPGEFSDGRAKVGFLGEYFNQYYYIDKTGERVISCDYAEVGYPFSEGAAVIDRNFDFFEIGMYYIDINGNRLFSGMYDDAGSFSEGLAAVAKDIDGDGETEYGYINKAGEIAIPLQYNYASPFSEGLAYVVPVSGRGYYIDSAGNKVMSPDIYATVQNFSNGLAMVGCEQSDGTRKYGYIDKTGKEVIPCQYDIAYDFSEGLAVVGTGEYGRYQYCYIDQYGNVVADFGNYYGIPNAFHKSGTALGHSNIVTIPGYVPPEVYFSSAAPGDVPPSVERSTTAYASTQSVLVDGKPVEFQMYALRDAKGNETNYVKLRDVASVLNGTAAQFNAGWNGSVNIEKGKVYVPNGSEMTTPFSGDRSYQTATAGTNVDGVPVSLEAFVLTDDKGSGYTYYKLRDLGGTLDFKVGWSAEKGIFIETK